jgi:diadenosine tetraphosphatase ApaH/serine/threonine PP2A family protein phosphatase
VTSAPVIDPVTIPDELTVWAASDVHGQLRAFDRLLARAGLTNGADRWIAPPGSGLVITGDMVDRGPDTVGLVHRLASLREQAASAGGQVALLWGNHEAQVLGGLGAEPSLFQALMTFGGGATLLSAGMAPGEWNGLDAEAIAARVGDLAPDLVPTLWTFAPYARWRDVLFVHGGPVPFQSLDAFERSAQRLWIRAAFFDSPDAFPEADAWTPYREAGLTRVVFGHTPVERPTTSHDGHAVNLDTWRGQQVTLARIAGEGDLAGSLFLSEPAEPRALPDAPVTPDDVRAFDAALPAVVDAWVAAQQSR